MFVMAAVDRQRASDRGPNLRGQILGVIQS